MKIEEHVLLEPYTTFHLGGPARAFAEVSSQEDLSVALAHARAHDLPLFILGAGSNVLVPDAGIDGFVLRMAIGDIAIEDDGEHALLTGGAGTAWDAVVDAATAQGLFGIENLAGIPGTLGGAAVQNIGAYGSELSEVFVSAEIIDSTTGERRRILPEEAAFGYRRSMFKRYPQLIITRVTLRLPRHGELNTTYADIARLQEAGEALATPSAVAHAVRRVRAGKFPSMAGEEGTAGSFFKNPSVSAEKAAELRGRFPELPAFPQQDGSVKLSLAWILDHVLGLKGYEKGSARLYEKQPLVVVARPGASATEVDALAKEIQERVLVATGIAIEREVETFGMRI